MNKKLCIVLVALNLPGIFQADPIKTDKPAASQAASMQVTPEGDALAVVPDAAAIEDIAGDIVKLDQIECVVCGPECNTALVDSDATWKRDLNGAFIAMQKQIQGEIVNQQIISEKMPLDTSAIEKYIEGIKRQNNLSNDDLGTMFEQVGRTTAEGLALLQNQYTQEFFTHFKFKSQLVATDDEINAYFNEYPEFIDGSCTFVVAHVAYGDLNKNEIAQHLQEYVKTGTCKDITLDFSEPVQKSLDDLAIAEQFVLGMQVGDTTVQEYDGYFEATKLLDQQPTTIKPLEQRRASIIELLNRKKLDQMLTDYNKSVQEFIDVMVISEHEVQQDLG